MLFLPGIAILLLMFVLLALFNNIVVFVIIVSVGYCWVVLWFFFA